MLPWWLEQWHYGSSTHEFQYWGVAAACRCAAHVEDEDKVHTQEWMTRLLVLFMTNYDGDATDFDEDVPSLYKNLLGAFPDDQKANLLYFYKQVI